MSSLDLSKSQDSDSHQGKSTTSSRRGTSLSSASFRSVASFRSFNSFKSIGSFRSVISHSSYKSCYTGHESYKSCYTGHDNLGYLEDNENENKEVIEEVDHANTKVESKIESGRRNHLYLGYTLQYVAACLLSISTLLLQMFIRDNSSFSSTFWLIIIFTSLVLFICSLPFVFVKRCYPLGPPGYRWRVYLTCLISAGLVLALFLSHPDHLPSLITLTTPTTLLLSLLLTRESLGVYRLLTTCLLLIGTTLLVRPHILHLGPQNHNNKFNIAQFNLACHPVAHINSSLVVEEVSNSTIIQSHKLAISPPYKLTTSLISALSVPILSSCLVVLHHQCRSGGTRPPVLLVWSSLGSGVTSIIGLSVKSGLVDVKQVVSQLSSYHWLLLCLVVVLSCLSYTISIVSLAWIPPGKSVLIRSSQILVTFLLQLGFLPSFPSVWLDLAGVVCVSLVVLGVGVEDAVVNKKRWSWF